MSRRLKKCWVCDKCGEVRIDRDSTQFAKILPSGWMFMNNRGFSNSCICGDCMAEIVKDIERSKKYDT